MSDKTASVHSFPVMHIAGRQAVRVRGLATPTLKVPARLLGKLVENLGAQVWGTTSTNGPVRPQPIPCRVRQQGSQSAALGYSSVSRSRRVLFRFFVTVRCFRSLLTILPRWGLLCSYAERREVAL